MSLRGNEYRSVGQSVGRSILLHSCTTQAAVMGNTSGGGGFSSDVFKTMNKCSVNSQGGELSSSLAGGVYTYKTEAKASLEMCHIDKGLTIGEPYDDAVYVHKVYATTKPLEIQNIDRLDIEVKAAGPSVIGGTSIILDVIKDGRRVAWYEVFRSGELGQNLWATKSITKTLTSATSGARGILNGVIGAKMRVIMKAKRASTALGDLKLVLVDSVSIKMSGGGGSSTGSGDTGGVVPPPYIPPPSTGGGDDDEPTAPGQVGGPPAEPVDPPVTTPGDSGGSSDPPPPAVVNPPPPIDGVDPTTPTTPTTGTGNSGGGSVNPNEVKITLQPSDSEGVTEEPGVMEEYGVIIGVVVAVLLLLIGGGWWWFSSKKGGSSTGPDSVLTKKDSGETKAATGASKAKKPAAKKAG